MFDFSTLITDRTSSDLQSLRDLLGKPVSEWTEAEKAEFNLARSKGAYNYTDLNRVTACMNDLNEVLMGLGYETGYHGIIIHPNGAEPTLWCEEDVPTLTQMQRYLYNVEALRGALELPEDTAQVPADMVGLTLTEANNIEEILQIIYNYLTALQKIFLRSGMAWAVSGGPGFYFVN